MISRVLRRPVAFLTLAITAIFGASYTSAHAQTQTRHLVFSTYLGPKTPPTGPAHTFAQNCACDAQGNVYVTGATDISNLPVSPNAFQTAPASGSTQSAFVAKYDPNGNPLWCTYLGGDNQSLSIGVAAMPSGGAVVVGLTTSDNFPTTSNAYQTQYNGNSDYFVTVFDANGTPTFSTYLGGSGVEGQLPTGNPAHYADDQNNGNCVTVDAQGLVYVAGITASLNFPKTSNAQQGANAGGAYDACLCIVDPSQSGLNSLIYGSYLGGGGDDQGHSVAVNASGSLIAVAGYTTSINFPLRNAFDHAVGSSSSGFVTQFQSTQPGSPTSTYKMLYSTYVGGGNRDDTYGMTMDPTGLIVATGRTQDSDFPMVSGGPAIFNIAPSLTNDMPYVVKINPTLSGAASLVYSTFLGGEGGFCTSMGVDAKGAVYVAGESTASGAPYVPQNGTLGDTTAPATFPYTKNALIKVLPFVGNEHVIFMVIDPSGANLGYATYLGGSGGDRAYGLAVDPNGNIFLSGLTSSQDFPTTVNAAQGTWPGGNQNAFVTKFSANTTPWIAELMLLLLED